MIKYRINPYDVLMFRESRSFKAGEGHIARSTEHFYSAVAGAIRSKIFEETGDKELIGYGEDEPKFQIIGSFYASPETTFFSMPGDIVKVKSKQSGNDKNEDCKGKSKVKLGKLRWLRREYSVFYTGQGFSFKPCDVRYMDKDTFLQYLKEFEDWDLNNIKKWEKVKKERRVGIRINSSSGTADEGYFYKSEFLRFENDLRIEVWIKDDEYGNKAKEVLGENGILKIGGEGRFGKYEFVSESNNFDKFYKGLDEKCLKIYLATPVILPNGKGTLKEYFKKEFEGIFGVNVDIAGMLLGKIYPLSGWDMKKNKPKPVSYVIPSGSVIYIKLRGPINTPSFPIKLGELKKLGYGLVFTSKWRC